jgi:dihydroorotate dehydrogenase (fumarate)
MSVDLEVDYLGLQLRNPLVAGASPLNASLEKLRVLDESGIGAVVLPSLFEEQIVHEESQIGGLGDIGAESYGEALGYFPPMGQYNTGTEHYLELVQQASDSLSVPVIASLNGTTDGGWTRYAKLLEEAGAAAIELNIYLLATDAEVTGAQVEERTLDVVRAVRSEVSLPLAVKVGPFFSSIANMARRFEEAGANGLVIFNRFLQPDIDLESLTVAPGLELSHSFESRLPMRWIAILRDQLSISLAATTGIYGVEDVIKQILCGADAVMLASLLLRHGPESVSGVRRRLAAWLEENDYESVAQMRGSMSLAKVPDPGAYERANYVKNLVAYAGPHI